MRRAVVLAALVTCLGAHQVRAEVRITLHDGLVSLTTRDATVQQILVEWARVGHTKIVNVDKLSGGPLTLELTDMPEQRVLQILLRSVSGYLAAPRPTAMANASRFDRIILMPTAGGARTAGAGSSPSPASRGGGGFGGDDAPAEPYRAVQPQMPQMPPGQRPPVFNVMPIPENFDPQPVVPQQPPPAEPPPATPTAMPSVPGGTSVPGVIVAPPPAQQPGGAGQQQQQP